MALPLEGIKVVELALWILGPSAAALLADAGAEVIKLEHPQGGDPLRGFFGGDIYPPTSPIHYGIELVNHNKRSIALNPRAPEGREIAYKLVERADVFVTNLLPDSLNRLKMDYQTLSPINPRLIYAHGTGYGPKGPDKDRTAFDELAFWARGGFMLLLGEPDAPAVPEQGAPGDLTTGAMLYTGIVTALFHRERTGKGQEVNVSLFATALWVNGWHLQISLLTGQDFPRRSRRKSGSPLYNSYQARDGKWFMLAMLDIERFWPALCRAVGREGLITDPRFNTKEKVAQNDAEAIAVLDKVFSTKTLAEWAKSFDEHGLVWAPAATFAEIAQDPQALANNYFAEIDHPTGQRIKVIAAPFQLSQTPLQVKSAAPALGQHTQEVLRELGYSREHITALREKKVIL